MAEAVREWAKWVAGVMAGLAVTVAAAAIAVQSWPLTVTASVVFVLSLFVISAACLSWWPFTARRLLPNAAPPSEQSADRVTVDVSPNYLMSTYKAHSTMDAGALVARYLGKWLPISGLVDDIIPGETIDCRKTLLIWLQWRVGDVGLYFNDEWVPRVETLRRGDRISAWGKIDSVNALSVTLVSCELR